MGRNERGRKWPLQRWEHAEIKCIWRTWWWESQSGLKIFLQGGFAMKLTVSPTRLILIRIRIRIRTQIQLLIWPIIEKIPTFYNFFLPITQKMMLFMTLKFCNSLIKFIYGKKISFCNIIFFLWFLVESFSNLIVKFSKRNHNYFPKFSNGYYNYRSSDEY